MFENNGGNKVEIVSLPLEEILSPYWNLLLQCKFLNNDFSSIRIPDSNVEYNDLLCEIIDKHSNACSRIEKELEGLERDCESWQKQFIELQSRKEEFHALVFDCVMKYIKHELFHNVGAIERAFSKNCLYVSRGENLTLLTIGDTSVKTEDSISRFLRIASPIDIFWSICVEGKLAINTTKQQSIGGCYDGVRVENIQDVLSPIYHRSILDEKKTQISEEIIENVWVNRKLIKKHFGISISDESVCLHIYDSADLEKAKCIGIAIGEYILPAISNFEQYVHKNLDYYWTHFKNGVYHRLPTDKEKSSINNEKLKSPLTKDFLLSAKKDELTKVLSALRHNLYVFEDQTQIDKKIEFFFNAHLIDDLDQLDNNEFMVSSHDDEIKLAIYNKNKLSRDSLNLSHYITKDEKGSLINQRGEKKQKIKSNNILILKPDISFYYIRLFYEEFFSNALRDIAESESIQYVFNQIVTNNNTSNEIDAIVRSKDSIWFVELKTNLSTEYIFEYRSKCKKWMEICPEIASHMKFAILGFTGKRELDAWQSDAVLNDGYKSSSYCFTINIDETNKLLCCTESSYDKLKELITAKFINA